MLDIDFLGGLPDWLQVGLAIVSLGGGVGVGAFQAGVRRTRLDDRRLLLRDWTATMGTLCQRTAGSGRNELRRAERIANQRLDNLREHDDINSVFQLLPWPDRALWVRHVRHVLGTGGQPLADLMAYSRMLGSDELALQMELGGAQLSDLLHTEVERSVAELDSTVNAVLGGFRTDYARPDTETYLALRDHLIRRSNPSLLSRWSSTRTTIGLWVHGPRPFSAAIKPRNLVVDYQIKAFTGHDLEFRWHRIAHLIESA